jgi:predicted RND superfamily exporter protein
MNLSSDNEINDKIDTDEQRLRMTCNCDVQDSSKDLEMMAWVEKWWAENSDYAATVQGQTVIFSSMQSGITDTLIVSISLTLLIVMIAMFVIYKDIKLLWLFMLPNLAPIVLTAGFMGYLGIRIDVGVAISAAVILGIAVDDTIHFFSKYFKARKTESFEDAIDYVLKHSGNAMILTTFILSFTFGIFTVSRFIPNINFAIVTITALNIALILDLVLLPALLSLFDKRGN